MNNIATNTPYVKRYDENGQVKNPIRGAYINHGINRRGRRQKNKTPKPDRIQTIVCRDPKTGMPTGEIRQIKHYES